MRLTAHRLLALLLAALVSLLVWQGLAGGWVLIAGIILILSYLRLEQTRSALEARDQELKRTQARLVEASRRVGMADVATAVLHNVGNVLNSVNVSASMVEERLRAHKSGRLGKIVELLQDNCERPDFLLEDPRGRKLPEYLARLTEGIDKDNLEIASELEQLRKNVEHIKVIVSTQQSHAKGCGRVEMIDAGELLEEVLRLNADSFARHGVEVVRELGPVPRISLDRHKAFQIVMNLLTNARHAVMLNSVGERRITVRAFVEGARVLVQISDNGCGIAPENLGRLFHLGFTTKEDGHGFGLHSSANAARELQGDLTARSDGPGRGATFTLSLPASESTDLEEVA